MVAVVYKSSIRDLEYEVASKGSKKILMTELYAILCLFLYIGLVCFLF